MVKAVKPPQVDSYLSWDKDDEKGKALAFGQAAAALKKVEPIIRTRGSDVFFNIAPGNVSVRDEFNRQDYDTFRRSEALPRTPQESILACNNVYFNIGIVRNIIDLMGDFSVQGIDVCHPNERIEKFYKEWFRRVSGPDRSERFCNLLYRAGNVIVKRQTAKLTVKDEENLKKAVAEPDVEVDEPIKLLKREIPWRYTFLNPLTLKLMGEDLAPFLGLDQFQFGLRIDQNLAQKIRKPRNQAEQEMVSQLPDDIVAAIKQNKLVVPLDSEKVRAFYYKRDDWQAWAYPMVHSILSDLNSLQKMKLADLAALDGAISCIRVWKLGNIEARIIPNEALIMRLAEMLTNNVGGGVMDLIWGPDIELLETNTDVHQFLGDTKYAPTLTAIYAGLGVPPTLTGAATQSGFTNNFISLQTMTERLEYGRSILRQFWEYEIRLVQRAMGFRFPATLVFDRMTLSDEASEKQLLLNMADRDIISWESVVERFGETPEIEAVRLRRERRKREEGQMPPKASPFHDAEQDYGFKKIFAQGGVVTPSQVGVELDENKDGEKTLLEQTGEQANKQQKQQSKDNQATMDHQFRTEKLQLKHGVHPNQMALQTGPAKKGQPGQGRPKLSKDSSQRKQKTVKPRTSADFVQDLATAEHRLNQLAEIVTPIYLHSLSKKNLRQLTEDEATKFEQFKFFCLCQCDLEEDVIEADVKEIVSTLPLLIPTDVKLLYEKTIESFQEKYHRAPPMEILRRFQASVFALYKGDY